MSYTLILNMDYVIHTVVFPTGKIHGMIELDEEGRAIILLNDFDSRGRQIEALKHELLHYIFSDHYRDRDFVEDSLREVLPLYDIEIGPGTEYIRIWRMSKEELIQKYGKKRYFYEFAEIGA